MRNLKSYHFLLAVLIVGLFVLGYLSYRLAQNPQPELSSTSPSPIETASPAPSPSPAGQFFLLFIDYGTELPPSIYQLPHTASTSAFTLLQDIAVQENIDLQFKAYSFGNLVESINGYANSADKAWIYFVNDQSPATGASDYILKSGDIVKWKYVKPE